MVCSPQVIWAKQSDSELKGASSDFNFARETYNQVLEKIQYDSSALEKQLAFNKKREKELQAELKAKERFLIYLPRRMGKYLSQIKRTTDGKNEGLLEQAAGEFRADYDALRQATIEEIATLKKDLANVRLRIAALEPQIELRGLKKELHLTGVRVTTVTDDKSAKSAVIYLEGIAAEAMQKEIGELGNLEVIPITEDDPYRANLLNSDL